MPFFFFGHLGPNTCKIEFPGPDCKILGTTGKYSEDSACGEEDIRLVPA